MWFRLLVFSALMPLALGSCLGCYELMEQCLFSGACTPTDKKYVTVETLRRLIARDCPIRNAGPCPKAKPVVVPDCTCICPTVECISTSTSTTANTTPTSTTAITTMASTTVTPACVCPVVASTTQSSCETSLNECQNSLAFTGTSKSGAQSSRDELSKQLEDLGVELLGLNNTRMFYQNRSIDLVEELRICLVNSGNYSDLFWVLKSQLDTDLNATELWTTCLSDKGEVTILSEDRRHNLTLCEGDLTATQSSVVTLEGALKTLENKALDLQRICDEMTIDYRELNRTYYQQRQDEDIFTKEITNHKFPPAKGKTPVSVKSVKCRICETQLSAKNDSLNALQVRYVNQTLVFSNLTSHFKLCEGARSSLAGRVVTLEGQIEDLEKQIGALQQKVGDEHQAYLTRIKGLRVIVQKMQRHLLCMQTEEQCQEESEEYVCLPKDILTTAFLTMDVEGQELFGLPTGHFLGDITWQSLDWQKFRDENPQIFVALVVLVTFASVGVTAILLLMIGCLIYYRRPIKSGFGRLKSFCGRIPESSILKKRTVDVGKVGSDLPKDEAAGGSTTLDPTVPSKDSATTESPKASTSTAPPTFTPGGKRKDLNAAWKKNGDRWEKDESTV